LIVIDVSAALSWLFADERDDVSAAMLKCVVGTPTLVPALWRWEMQNALLMAERRGRIAVEDTGRILQELEALGIEVDSPQGLDACAGLTLARNFSLTAYDAAYLELAIRRNAKLMTRDGPLAQAAEQMGILWTP
jgi:predicted nucleic acid-binding protein